VERITVDKGIGVAGGPFTWLQEPNYCLSIGYNPGLLLVLLLDLTTSEEIYI
jgi:hypothetical protein